MQSTLKATYSDDGSRQSLGPPSRLLGAPEGTAHGNPASGWSVTGTSRTGYQVPKRAGSQRIAGRRAAQSAIPAGSTESEPSRGSHLDGPPSRDSLLPSLRRLVSKVCSSLAIPEEDLPFGSQGETDEWREYVAEHRNAKRDKRLERDTEVENEKDSEVEDDSCSEKGL